MTKEELKQTYSMEYIVRQYGLRLNKAGAVICPFHNERTASMKIYKDSYHCFGCDCSGDIFTFVQQMDGVSFKEAFMSLGGEYEKPTFESKLALYRHKKKQELIAREKLRIKEKKKINNMLISVYRHWTEKAEPLSDTWCDCYNALYQQLRMHESLNERR